MRQACVFWTLLVGLFACSSTALPPHCLRYEPATVTLTGQIIARDFAGPSNYEGVAEGDTEETADVLVLSEAVCVAADPSSELNSEGFSNVTEVQLVGAGHEHRDRHVRVRGHLFAGHSGHHWTRVLLSVTELEAPPSLVEIEVTRPMVVGFFPPVFEEHLAADHGLNSALAHLGFALTDVANCLGPRDVAVRGEFASALVFHDGGQSTRVEIPSDWQHALGAYLVEPGREPRPVYATAGPGSLIMFLPNAAAEYFAAPECEIEF